ncbi:MAG: recombinase RmuC [Segetibacter sp.]|nr:recombinase RmuC [Segetibacter sp.]
MYIICFAAGVLISALVCIVLFKSSKAQLTSGFNERMTYNQLQLNQLGEEKKLLQQEKDVLLHRTSTAETNNRHLAENYNAYLELQKDFQLVKDKETNLTAQLRYTREKLDNQQNDILRLREQFRLEFTDLSNKILDDQSKKFTEANELKMKQILDPLKMNLIDFKQKVEETYDKESKERFSLSKEVQRLIEMSQLVSKEANNLTTALKGNTKMQGNWGEMILESLLENSGLTKGREYFLQEFIRDKAGNTVKDEYGKALQPDVTILYPDQRKIIIDSKVSLISWEKCIGCDDREVQKQFLKEHILSIRQHIDGLSRKNYSKYALALDYVLMFIPIEPAFLEAVKSDLQLWKYAYEKRILLVSPTNLFSVLKIIADLWKIEQQNKNAIEIAEKAGALYDKVVGFVDNMECVGKKLSEATDHYTNAFKQLTTGRGNIVNRMEELKKMGADAKKQLPDKLLNDSY